MYKPQGSAMSKADLLAACKAARAEIDALVEGVDQIVAGWHEDDAAALARAIYDVCCAAYLDDRPDLAGDLAQSVDMLAEMRDIVAVAVADQAARTAGDCCLPATLTHAAQTREIERDRLASLAMLHMAEDAAAALAALQEAAKLWN